MIIKHALAVGSGAACRCFEEGMMVRPDPESYTARATSMQVSGKKRFATSNLDDQNIPAIMGSGLFSVPIQCTHADARAW